MPYKVTEEMRIARRCAIARRGLSRPAGRLDVMWSAMDVGFERGGCALHLGEGRALDDTALLHQYFGHVRAFDPNFEGVSDDSVLNDEYDVVLSVFVANVFPPKERDRHYDDIVASLLGNGYAYLAVRSIWDRSIKGEPDQDGVRTSRGTFQKAYTVESLLDELTERFVVRIIESGSKGYILAELAVR